jgi:hypothetical protein
MSTPYSCCCTNLINSQAGSSCGGADRSLETVIRQTCLLNQPGRY